MPASLSRSSQPHARLLQLTDSPARSLDDSTTFPVPGGIVDFAGVPSSELAATLHGLWQLPSRVMLAQLTGGMLSSGGLSRARSAATLPRPVSVSRGTRGSALSGPDASGIDPLVLGTTVLGPAVVSSAGSGVNVQLRSI